MWFSFDSLKFNSRESVLSQFLVIEQLLGSRYFFEEKFKLIEENVSLTNNVRKTGYRYFKYNLT